MTEGKPPTISASVAVVLTFGCILLVGFADYYSGFEVSLSVFYALPIAFGVWYSGRLTGTVAAIVAVAAWILADHLAGHHYQNDWIPVWNAFVRFAFLMLIVTGAYYTRLQLRQSRARTAALESTLPVCTCCKRIRGEDGAWVDVETYIAEHFPTEPEAKVCPDCSRNLYVDKVSPHSAPESAA